MYTCRTKSSQSALAKPLLLEDEPHDLPKSLHSFVKVVWGFWGYVKKMPLLSLLLLLASDTKIYT